MIHQYWLMMTPAVLKLTQLCCTWPYCAEVGPTVLKLVQLFYSKVGPTVIKLVQLLSSWSNCSEVDLAVLKLTPLYWSWPNYAEVDPTVLKLDQLFWSWPNCAEVDQLKLTHLCAGNQPAAERRLHLPGGEQAGERLQPHPQPSHQV